MGNQLFTDVTDLTGLPKDLISEELVEILGQVGASPQAVTLDALREAMAMYLTEVIGPELMAEGVDGDAQQESSAEKLPTEFE